MAGLFVLCSPSRKKNFSFAGLRCTTLGAFSSREDLDLPQRSGCTDGDSVAMARDKRRGAVECGGTLRPDLGRCGRATTCVRRTGVTAAHASIVPRG